MLVVCLLNLLVRHTVELAVNVGHPDDGSGRGHSRNTRSAPAYCSQQLPSAVGKYGLGNFPSPI